MESVRLQMRTPQSEHRLVQQAQDGDKVAFAELFNAHYKSIFRFLRKTVQDEHHAEDLCSEAFAIAWDRIKTFQGKSRFSTWLFGIARNVAKYWLRGEIPRQRRNRRLSPEAHEGRVQSTDSGENEEDFRMFLCLLKARGRRKLAEKLEQDRELRATGKWDTLSKSERQAYRARENDARKIVSGLSRRGFFVVTALTAGEPYIEGVTTIARPPSLQADDIDELVTATGRRRAETGNIALCRTTLNDAWNLFRPELRNIGQLTPPKAELLLRFTDLQLALSLDAFEVQHCSSVLLPRMQELIRRLRDSERRSWERRLLRNQTRFYSLQGDCNNAAACARAMTDGAAPTSPWWVTHGGSFGSKPKMTPFEVSLFARHLHAENGSRWWRDAYRQLRDAGDPLDAARIEARLLGERVLKAPRDRGLATDAVGRLGEMEAQQPKLVLSPFLSVQYRACQIRCLAAAGMREEAISMFRRVAAKAERLGYKLTVERVGQALALLPPTS